VTSKNNPVYLREGGRYCRLSAMIRDKERELESGGGEGGGRLVTFTLNNIT
jgi:hypothetical protein